MSSLFNQDWNDDGEVDELDSAIDMMLIEDLESKPNNSYRSSTDKTNDLLRPVAIAIFYLFAFISPIVTIGMPFLSDFEEMKDEGVLLGYFIFVMITIVEIVYFIKRIIKHFSQKSYEVKQENASKKEVESLILKAPECETRCANCGCGFNIKTNDLLKGKYVYQIECPNCHTTLYYPHINARELQHDMKCLGFISSRIK